MRTTSAGGKGPCSSSSGWNACGRQYYCRTRMDEPLIETWSSGLVSLRCGFSFRCPTFSCSLPPPARLQLRCLGYGRVLKPYLCTKYDCSKNTAAVLFPPTGGRGLFWRCWRAFGRFRLSAHLLAVVLTRHTIIRIDLGDALYWNAGALGFSVGGRSLPVLSNFPERRFDDALASFVPSMRSS